MGVDLKLMAMPPNLTIEKFSTMEDYEDILSGIWGSFFMEDELLHARAEGNDAEEKKLMYILEIVYELRKAYPGQDPKPYLFDSYYRAYGTLNFLVSKHCKVVGKPFFHFFKGKHVTSVVPNNGIRYHESQDVARINGLLSGISFQELMEQYDYEEVSKNAYKAKSPDELHYVEKEYQELVLFFEQAAALNTYIVIHIY